MKKTLMALAVGAAFAAPAAYADVTISGAINMGIAYADSSDGDSGSNDVVGSHDGGGGVSQSSVTSNYSNVTISSTDDLGGGLKLDFAFQLVAPTNTNSNVANRNSHIGLVSEHWGGVWYGTNENIYERYLYSIDPLDGAAGIGGNLQMLGTPGYGTVFDAPSGPPSDTSFGGDAGFYRRTEHTLWYDSPNFAGFTFGVAWYMPAYDKEGIALSNPTGFSAGVKWAPQNLPLQLWGAYEQHDDYNGLGPITLGQNDTPSDTKDTAMQLGGSFALGDLLLFAIYERLEYEAEGLASGVGNVSKYERDAWAVGAKWNLASGYVGAQYIQALEADCEVVGGSCNADGSGGKMVGLGYYHTMSKQTQSYIMGTWIDNDENQNYSLAGANTPNDVGGRDPQFDGLGATHWAITVGLKHSF
jgi:predicted porin